VATGQNQHFNQQQRFDFTQQIVMAVWSDHLHFLLMCGVELRVSN
jgi:hypothetical protein